MSYVPSLENIVSAANSTTTALDSSGVFTGVGVDTNEYSTITVSAFTDQSGTLSIQFSSDNTNWDIINNHTITANTGFTETANVGAKYFRIVFTNGAVSQTVLRLQSMLTTGKAPDEEAQLSQILDIGNSTTTAATTFTGVWSLDPNYNGVMVTMAADVAGTLYFDFFDQDEAGTIPTGATSPTSTYPPSGFDYNGNGFNEFHQAVKGPRWFRTRWIGSSLPTTLRVSSYKLFTVQQPQVPLKQMIPSDADTLIARVPNEIEIMKGRYEDEIIINKFGRNPDIDTGTTPECIWQGGGLYTGFPTTAAEEFQVLSSDANDTAAGTGARTVRIYYLDDDYSGVTNVDYPYVDVTLNGTTPVNSGITGMRVALVTVLTSGSGETNAGDITVRWRTTTSVIFAVMPAGFSQTQICAFTVPHGYTGYIKQYGASMATKNTNDADIAIRVREPDSNTWASLRTFIISTEGAGNTLLYGGFKMLEKTDMEIICSRVANNNAVIVANFDIHLIKNT